MSADPRLAPIHGRIAEALRPPGDHTDGLYHWLRYQMGWSEPDGRPVDRRTAKGVRPLVCVLCNQAVDGDAAAAVAAAAAIELTHEFSLIHDDIEDGDRTRRGRAALWTITGVPQGINAGDAMFAVARDQIALSPVPDATQVEMFRRYDRACRRLAEGQYLDLAFEAAGHPSEDEYIDMVSRKTGALLEAAAALGALTGGADEAKADALGRFGEALGVAFQIQDDVLGLWGDPARTGKPVGNDLRRRKKSLPVLLALDEPSLAPHVMALLEEDEPAAEAAADLARRMEAAGIRDRVSVLARRRVDAATAILDQSALRRGPCEELAALVRRAVERDR